MKRTIDKINVGMEIYDERCDRYVTIDAIRKESSTVVCDCVETIYDPDTEEESEKEYSQVFTFGEIEHMLKGV